MPTIPDAFVSRGHDDLRKWVEMMRDTWEEKSYTNRRSSPPPVTSCSCCRAHVGAEEAERGRDQFFHGVRECGTEKSSDPGPTLTRRKPSKPPGCRNRRFGGEAWSSAWKARSRRHTAGDFGGERRASLLILSLNRPGTSMRHSGRRGVGSAIEAKTWWGVQVDGVRRVLPDLGGSSTSRSISSGSELTTWRTRSPAHEPACDEDGERRASWTTSVTGST